MAAHSSNAAIAPSHNAALFGRADALAHDIELFSGDADWRSSREAIELERLAVPELAAYVGRLNALTASDATSNAHGDSVYTPAPAAARLLLAHAYVRYMGERSCKRSLASLTPRSAGDLSGGQTICKAVSAAYRVDPDALAFYRFGTIEEPESVATPSEMKRVKAWFRQGLDTAGASLTPLRKGAFPPPRCFLLASDGFAQPR